MTLVLTTIYCEADTCKYHTGSGCGADFITVNDDGECMGFKEENPNIEWKVEK